MSERKEVHLPVGDEPLRDERTVPNVCRSLRTKTAFGSDGGPGDWKFGDSTTAVYWCLRTMETFGPDGNFCHAHSCGPHRRCHRARDDA
jgi:hypothetical protein